MKARQPWRNVWGLSELNVLQSHQRLLSRVACMVPVAARRLHIRKGSNDMRRIPSPLSTPHFCFWLYVYYSTHIPTVIVTTCKGRFLLFPSRNFVSGSLPHRALLRGRGLFRLSPWSLWRFPALNQLVVHGAVPGGSLLPVRKLSG